MKKNIPGDLFESPSPVSLTAVSVTSMFEILDTVASAKLNDSGTNDVSDTVDDARYSVFVTGGGVASESCISKDSVTSFNDICSKKSVWTEE